MSTNPIYEGFNQDKTIDFAISKIKGKYLVDVFNASIEDMNKAYLETLTYDSLEEAKTDMKKYVLKDS